MAMKFFLAVRMLMIPLEEKTLMKFTTETNQLRKEKFTENPVLEEFIREYKNIASSEDFKSRFGNNINSF